MNNKAKKILALCLCVAMMAAMCISVSAAENEYPGKPTTGDDLRPAPVVKAEDTDNGKSATVTVGADKDSISAPADATDAAKTTAKEKLDEILDTGKDGSDFKGEHDGTAVETKVHGVSLTPDEYTDPTAVDYDTDESGKDKSGISPVMLEASGLYFSVTVPTVLPVYVDEKNDHFEAENVKIINNSYGPVKVTEVKVHEQNNWKLAEYDEKALDKEKVNTPKYGMMIDGQKVTAPTTGDLGTVTLGTELEKVMEPCSVNEDGDTATDGLNILTFGYKVKTAPQAAKVDREHAQTLGNVVFTLAWDAYVATPSTGD